MLLGGHFPISGGLLKALDMAFESGASTLQIFTKNPGQWKARPIDDKTAGAFIGRARELSIAPVIVHDSYLINMASADGTLLEKSTGAFIDEMERARRLGACCVITHMGAHRGAGEEEGLKILARSINRCIEATDGNPVMIVLETTAGQGTQLGYTFEHISRVLELCRGHNRIGVCVDTCHIFAAGYDISTVAGYEKTFEEFDRIIGLERLKVIHLNDAVKGPGSRVDRHAHPGEGRIGIEAFRRIVTDERFDKIPLIFETPDPPVMHRVHIRTFGDYYKEHMGQGRKELKDA